jgi:hypothetical protein
VEDGANGTEGSSESTTETTDDTTETLTDGSEDTGSAIELFITSISDWVVVWDNVSVHNMLATDIEFGPLRK